MTEDKNCHFERLRKLKYDIDKNQKLIDFFEDINYSYGKACALILDKEAKIRTIKAALPEELGPSLVLLPDDQEAKTYEELEKAIRSFDMSVVGKTTAKQVSKEPLTRA